MKEIRTAALAAILASIGCSGPVENHYHFPTELGETGSEEVEPSEVLAGETEEESNHDEDPRESEDSETSGGSIKLGGSGMVPDMEEEPETIVQTEEFELYEFGTLLKCFPAGDLAKFTKLKFEAKADTIDPGFRMWVGFDEDHAQTINKGTEVFVPTKFTEFEFNLAEIDSRGPALESIENLCFVGASHTVKNVRFE